jgi:hypothetical protein
MRNKTNKFIHKFYFINSVAAYNFRPPIVAIFREVFFEGYITYNVKTIYKCKMLSLK